MQASEDLTEKGSKPAARLGRPIKSSGTLFTVHFVFVFPERFSHAFVSLCWHYRDTIWRATDPRFKEKHECICHTDYCISHRLNDVGSEGTFAAQKAGRATFTIGRCSWGRAPARLAKKQKPESRLQVCARRLRRPGLSLALIKAHDAARLRGDRA